MFSTVVRLRLWSWFPQGSVLGPVLFLVYSADAIAISDKHGFSAHVYADDMQLYDHADQHDCASLIVRLSTCVGEISEWMASNRLCLNPMKTEIIWLESTRRIANCAVDPQDIAGAMIVPSKLIRDLGVMVDDDLTLTAHVSHLSSSSFYQLRQLRAIRCSLSTDTAHALVRALVHKSTRLLQRSACRNAEIQHRSATICASIAARLTLRLPSCASVTDLMRRQLHWLPIRERISYKLCTLAYKCLHSLAPSYLIELCVSCGCCSWTYAATIGCQGRSRDSRYTNQNYWSTWFFICLSVGLERFAYAFEKPFHHFHNFQKTAENFFILEILITV